MQNQDIRQKIILYLNYKHLHALVSKGRGLSMKNFYQFIGVHFTILIISHLLRIDSIIKNLVAIVVKICNYT
jgi:hypothetical protein